VSDQVSARWFPDAMPVPAASPDTLPWWQAAAEHRLVVQVCEGCGRHRHPPSPICPRCRSWASSFVDHPGTGTIYTFTVVHQPFVPGVPIPYVVAVIELTGTGTRLVTNLVDTEPSEVRIGDVVQIVWEDMGPELAVPRAHRVAAEDTQSKERA
jgi:uncharacterized OB-fold protein